MEEVPDVIDDGFIIRKVNNLRRKVIVHMLVALISRGNTFHSK